MNGVTKRDVLGELRHSARSLARATNLRDRWLLWAGSLVVLTGLLLILLGYRGAAHAPRVIQQIPYEISGGILGLALVFAGSFSYFAWWLTQVVRHQDRLAARIDAQTATLTAELRSLRDAMVPAPTAQNLVRTPTGSRVHLAGCTLLDGKPTVPATDGDLQPCKACLPHAPTPNGGSARVRSWGPGRVI